MQAHVVWPGGITLHQFHVQVPLAASSFPRDPRWSWPMASLDDMPRKPEIGGQCGCGNRRTLKWIVCGCSEGVEFDQTSTTYNMLFQSWVLVNTCSRHYCIVRRLHTIQIHCKYIYIYIVYVSNMSGIQSTTVIVTHAYNLYLFCYHDILVSSIQGGNLHMMRGLCVCMF